MCVPVAPKTTKMNESKTAAKQQNNRKHQHCQEEEEEAKMAVMISHQSSIKKHTHTHAREYLYDRRTKKTCSLHEKYYYQSTSTTYNRQKQHAR
jgi:hypothetical protein